MPSDNDNLPVKDIAKGRVAVFGDMSQWDEDKARVQADIDSLAGKFGEKLKEAAREAGESFSESFKPTLDRLEGLIAELHRAQPDPGQPSPQADQRSQHQDDGGPRPSGEPAKAPEQTVALDEASKAALAGLKDSMDSLAAVLAQR